MRWIGAAAFIAVVLSVSLPLAAEAEKVRPPAVSGQFYPGSAGALEKEIRGFLAGASSMPDPAVRALIVPHAGYPYSGRIAAEAYKTVQGRNFDTVVILGFSHHVPFRGIYVDDHDAYETPLGRVRVDVEMARALRALHPVLQDRPSGSFEEHSVEVQVPFIQEALKGASIVPVYMGEQSAANAAILGDALAKTIAGKNVLVVVSTDLSHFHPYDEAVRKDRACIALIEASDEPGFLTASEQGAIEACGSGPVLALLALQKKMGWSAPALLSYANSGDVTGDRGRVVGYAAMKMRALSPA
ncbi:MAG: AmmeMemoRadiSam system protein B [Candidatus Omnitrophota bacterium]|jgi:hypothetical protein